MLLPRTYSRLDKELLVSLLKAILENFDGHRGRCVREDFTNTTLASSLSRAGQKGGEFFTPLSIVKLIAEIIKPFHGRIHDPACGSVGH